MNKLGVKIVFLLVVCFSLNVASKDIINDEKIKSKHGSISRFASYKGLVMAGYQGWFNAPSDGANRGWNHYQKDKTFEPGSCSIDFWPDMTEYKNKYKTLFKLSDGKPAYIFSSYDKSTTDLHFKWMREYDIDGAFVQRFVTNLKNKISLNHNNTVLANAYNAAGKNERAIAVMYDLSGCSSKDIGVVINDWKYLVDSLKITNRGKNQSALYHNEKPLVVLWGVGFKNRLYSTKDVAKIVDFLQKDPIYGGCAIMLGVPTFWRNFGNDTEQNLELHTLIKKVDIIQPWFVGRYNENNYQKFKVNIVQDLAWCKASKVDYVPVVFPGFSWHNMYSQDTQNATPRNFGKFYWQQLSGALELKVDMIYVAMFDEIDEGTAIFKITNNPPVGASTFVKLDEGLPSDFYLKLTSQASKMLKKLVPLNLNFPF